MKTRIVRIGNSRGIRIPKPFLEQARLREDVELAVVDNRLVISSPDLPRAGWDAAFRAMAAAGDDQLLDTPAPTAFDRSEWEWR
jgi:antitoxin MazE